MVKRESPKHYYVVNAEAPNRDFAILNGVEIIDTCGVIDRIGRHFRNFEEPKRGIASITEFEVIPRRKAQIGFNHNIGLRRCYGPKVRIAMYTEKIDGFDAVMIQMGDYHIIFPEDMIYSDTSYVLVNMCDFIESILALS